VSYPAIGQPSDESEIQTLRLENDKLKAENAELKEQIRNLESKLKSSTDARVPQNNQNGKKTYKELGRVP